MTTDRERRIRDEAYRIWDEAGRPEGTEQDHWLEAERRLALDDDAASPPSGARAAKAAAKRPPRAPVVKNAGNSGASGIEPAPPLQAPAKPRRTQAATPRR